MERIPIAELTPELPSLESKQFKAVVTLLWPYSSSTRQCALLLAEPDFRLRRKKGQVRVRFSGPSAKALATTGIGIGDEVTLGLCGAQFVQEDREVRTPGKSIDWELSFTQRLVVEISQDGDGIANLDVDDPAPIPCPESPVRRPPVATPFKGPAPTPSVAQQWFSPAFIKRALSDGSFFEAGYDPLAQDLEYDDEGHKKKRRRKSYKDWGVWTYSVRTPSPEKGDVESMEEDYSEMEASPTRPPLLPTPISPPKPYVHSVAAQSLGKIEKADFGGVQLVGSVGVIVENDHVVQESPDHRVVLEQSHETGDDDVRDQDYYDLYAGPDEFPPQTILPEFAGDTEPNTEEEDAEIAQQETSLLSATEVDSEQGARDEDLEHDGPGEIEETSDIGVLQPARPEVVVLSSTEENSFAELVENGEGDINPDLRLEERLRERSGTHEAAIVLDEVPEIVMPPPNLPVLQTDFASTATPGLLTPIGKEPPSPVIKPLDSSTLPMPSPFPGERDRNITSYLDHPGLGENVIQPDLTPAEVQEPSSEASYIVESSFYSSVSSANAPAFHPTHESAFTDVRFTFGMDGSAFSRLKAQPEFSVHGDLKMKDETEELKEEQILQDTGLHLDPELRIDLSHHAHTFLSQDAALQAEISHQQELENLNDSRLEGVYPAIEEAPELKTDTKTAPAKDNVLSDVAHPRIGEPDVIAISSDTESDTSEDEGKPEPAEENEDFSGMIVEDDQQTKSDQGDIPQIAFQDESDFEGDTEEDPDLYWERVEKAERREATSFADKEGRIETDPSGTTTEEVEAEVPEAQPPSGTQRSEAVTEIIDLGSGSEADSDEEGQMNNNLTGMVDDNETQDFTPRAAGVTGLPDHGEVPIHVPNAADPVDERGVHVSALSAADLVDDQNVPHGLRADDLVGVEEADDQAEGFNLQPDEDLAIDIKAEAIDYDQLVSFGDEIPQIAVDDQDEAISDAPSVQDTAQETLETAEQYPEVKMESIEEDAPFHRPIADESQMRDVDDESVAGPSAELLIAVPEEGHKMGELQFKAVSATGPARNTRSKTKASMSPMKDATPTSSRQPKTQTRALRASRTRSTISPVKTRAQSTLSPKNDVPTASPYGLRSRSKNLSPTKSATQSVTVPEIESPRKAKVEQRSSLMSSPLKSSFTGLDPSHFEPIEFPDTSFGPSQELGTSQGKFANVSFIRDSEEGSLHSEHSISTVQYSDDYDGFGTQTHNSFSDPQEPTTQIEVTNSLYPELPPSDPQMSGDLAQPSPQIPELRKSETQRRPSYSSTIQNPLRSPIKPQSAKAGMYSSPQRARRAVYDLSPDPPVAMSSPKEGFLGEATPKGQHLTEEAAYPELPADKDIIEIPGSPPKAVEIDERVPSSSPVNPELEARLIAVSQHHHISSSPSTELEPEEVSVSANRQTPMNSNMPITPDATQLEFADSQPTFPTAQVEQSLPLTPQLTQNTSVGLLQDSFKADVEMEEVVHEPLIKQSPLHKLPEASTNVSPLADTPRRNITATNVASRSVSSSIHSEDLSDSDDEVGLVNGAISAPPSVGLTTPLSYYTPLKGLSFFLNRSSSQHFGSSNPDILALVVEGTTPSKKVDKGPKHYTTTLKITDLSSFPSFTTVQVFRPFASALPVAEKGDVVLLRSFQVKSLNRKCMLISGEESAWVVWRYGKPLWGAKRGEFGEMKAREECRGPQVERGEGEWREAVRVRGWYVGEVKRKLVDMESVVGEEKKGKEGVDALNGLDGHGDL
ncbi:hypothetical protein K469DRAFT_797835 [Zopfia rhizophila CBS 207.26]|uniref:Telomeric single stranded DNA binding POT1/Cdc13 domain-containing protein n=1 Tax=Zopfia rhizophila CBS 207.26 TaxID=1314779 RepID=A0A6A6DNR5_9PEZI|nr:hypothetical protein K469DRAFT_797835 [Zopfia rhizophila CBS 207.26]